MMLTHILLVLGSVCASVSAQNDWVYSHSPSATGANGVSDGFSGVTHGPDKIVAVSFLCSEAEPNNTCVIASDDGMTWTNQEVPEKFMFTHVAYGNGKYVIVGNWGNTVNANAVPSLVSSDAVSWTSVPGLVDNDNVVWGGLAYGNGVFVVVSMGGPARSMTSSDGVNWVSVPFYNSQNLYSGLTFGGGLFVAVGNSGRVAKSSDGVTWFETVLTGQEVQDWTAVTYGNGLFVAVGKTAVGADTMTQAMTSPDGVVWTARVTPKFDTWRAIAYGQGVFRAVSGSEAPTSFAAQEMMSEDGITWTAVDLQASTRWFGITYCGHINMFVAVGMSDDNNLMTLVPPTTTEPTTVEPTTAEPTADDDDDGGMSRGARIGILITIIVVAFAAGYVFYKFYYRKNNLNLTFGGGSGKTPVTAV